MIAEMQQAASDLAERARAVRTEQDRNRIQRSAEHIYNIAVRNENMLTKQIARRRYPVARDFHRMELVERRHKCKLIQDHVKEIVAILEAPSYNLGALLHNQG